MDFFTPTTMLSAALMNGYLIKGTIPKFSAVNLDTEEFRNLVTHLNGEVCRHFDLALHMGGNPDTIRETIHDRAQLSRVAGLDGVLWLDTVLDHIAKAKPLSYADISHLDAQSILNAAIVTNAHIGSLTQGMPLDSIARIPAQKLRENVSEMKWKAKADFNRPLDDHVMNAEIPDALIERHHIGLNAFFERILTTPRLYNAARRIVSYRGEIDPRYGLSKDIATLQSALARAFGIPSLKLEFKAEAMSKIAGEASYEVHKDKTNKEAWYYTFINRLWLYQKDGQPVDGISLWESSAHELLHSMETMFIQRLLGDTKGLVKRQHRYFRRKNLDAWPLKEAAVQLALNTATLGRYIRPEEDDEKYKQQLRERHARWFAKQATRLVIDCVRTYDLAHQVLTQDRGSRKVIARTFVDGLSRLKASSKKNRRYMADIVTELPLNHLISKAREIDIDSADGLFAMRDIVTEYMRSVIDARDVVQGRLVGQPFGRGKIVELRKQTELIDLASRVSCNIDMLLSLQRGEYRWPHFSRPDKAAHSDQVVMQSFANNLIAARSSLTSSTPK